MRVLILSLTFFFAQFAWGDMVPRAMICNSLSDLVQFINSNGDSAEPSLRPRLESLILANQTGIYDTNINPVNAPDMLHSLDRAIQGFVIHQGPPGCIDLELNWH